MLEFKLMETFQPFQWVQIMLKLRFIHNLAILVWTNTLMYPQLHANELEFFPMFNEQIHSTALSLAVKLISFPYAKQINTK